MCKTCAKHTMMREMMRKAKNKKDGKGGPGAGGASALGGVTSPDSLGIIQGSFRPSDTSLIAPYRNSFYKRMKAAQMFQKIAGITGLAGDTKAMNRPKPFKFHPISFQRPAAQGPIQTPMLPPTQNRLVPMITRAAKHSGAAKGGYKSKGGGGGKRK